MPPKAVPLETRFWQHVHKTAACWIWTGPRARGYGQLQVRRSSGHGWISARAHRVAWAFARGPIPDGMCVLHRCDNPPCVRPDHLFLGTRTDNHRDMEAKGRARGGAVPGNFGNPRPGEGNGRAKLRAAQVAEIRRRYADGGVSQAALGAEYGVNQTMIGFIVRWSNWRPSHG